MIADADVEEVFLHELADAADVWVIGLLVEHRTAVAREAAGSAMFRFGEEQPGAVPLARRQRIFFSSEESVERCVTRDRCAQKRCGSPQDAVVVDELIECFLTRRIRISVLAGVIVPSFFLKRL